MSEKHSPGEGRGEGQWSEGHGPASLGNLHVGAKFSETSFPHFKTYFMHIKCNL